METKVMKWGNSLAIRIPAFVAAELALENGSKINIALEDKSLVITRSRPKYLLADLLTKMPQVEDDVS